MNKTIDALKLAEEAANRVIETLEYLKTIGIHPASLAPAIRAEKKALAALREVMAEQEKHILENMLMSVKTAEDKKLIAHKLGISLATLYRKMTDYHLS